MSFPILLFDWMDYLSACNTRRNTVTIVGQLTFTSDIAPEQWSHPGSLTSVCIMSSTFQCPFR